MLHRPRRAASFILVLAALAASAACGGSGAGPTPPGPAPTLTCPANVEVTAHNGESPVVNFDAPTAQGGDAPVTVACTPASGTTFPVGTSTVNCTATDAAKRNATCSFSVDVSGVPTLSKLKFVAFGDSLTEGQTSPDPTILLLNPADSYPSKLQQLLSARYVDQTIAVINKGRSGERVHEDGEKRLPGVLDNEKPDVLLLLDGANDLLRAGSAGDPEDAISPIVGSLEEMVQSAKRRHIAVMLATFPPQRRDGKRGAGAPAVPELNDEIRRLAADEGATLVDLYNGLGGTPEGSIGVDGLHPTASGYSKIAQIWFEAIQNKYEKAGARAVLQIPAGAAP
jgi:lysophospholipase L1-like esterase